MSVEVALLDVDLCAQKISLKEYCAEKNEHLKRLADFGTPQTAADALAKIIRLRKICSNG